jgi:hypothetical protein
MHKVIPYFGGYRRFDRVLLGIPRACSAVKGLARMRLVDNNGVPTRGDRRLSFRGLPLLLVSSLVAPFGAGGNQ